MRTPMHQLVTKRGHVPLVADTFDIRAQWLAAHVLPHETVIRSRLRRISGLTQADIDDLVQETYAVLAAKKKVADIADARAYALQTARSQFLLRLRKAKIVPLDYVADLFEFDAPDPASPLDDRTAAKDELQKVIDAIEALPPQMRRAFWLRRVEGWSQREIATELGLSESTVEKHIGRGIKRLLEQFGRGGNRKRAASTSATDVEPQESRPLERPSRVRGST